ncbi:hypothetical protein, partial [Myxococcus virescens]
MLFKVLPSFILPVSAHEQAFLVANNWDDMFEFETTFGLTVYDARGTLYSVGSVKIGQFGMTTRRPAIPGEFDALPGDFFSLGQEENYYETLYELGGFGERILKQLRDIAIDLELFGKARGERVTQRSLMRFVQEDSVRNRFHLLAQGRAEPTDFKFAYDFPPEIEDDTSPLSLSFEVTRNALPPTNVHVLIGRNGVGKTRFLRNTTHSLVVKGEKAAKVGRFRPGGNEGGSPPFVNLVSVAFSAFDPFGPVDNEKLVLSYSYIGLKKAREEQTRESSPAKENGEKSSATENDGEERS